MLKPEVHIGKGRPRMENMKQIMINMEKNKVLKELSDDKQAWRTAANQPND